MRVSLFSNFLNSHQLPLAKALSSRDDVDFRFVSFEQNDGQVGRDNLDAEYDFVIPAYKGGDALSTALDRARNDDVSIMAPMSGFEMFRDARDSTDGLTFLYSERLLKRGQWWRFAPPKVLRVHRQFFRFNGSFPYVLCSSAFTAADLDIFGFSSSRCYRWGYFPEVDTAGALPRDEKLPRYMSLGSAQRHIPLKHVELQLNVLQRLCEFGLNMNLRIAGDGPETPRLRKLARKLGVADRVLFLGQLTHEETLAFMRECDIFLATSDRKEGWGATVNEAMASGCVVVGSSLMGSVPFLIRDGIDGLIFNSGDIDSLERSIIRLAENPRLLPSLSKAAMRRVSITWNSHCAADRFLKTSESLLSGGEPLVYEDGPMSLAPILEDDWFDDSRRVLR